MSKHVIPVHREASGRVGKGAGLGIYAWAKSRKRRAQRGEDAGDFAHPTATPTMTVLVLS